MSDAAIHLKKLRFRSWHRGCKETDLILGKFADSRLETLDAPSLALYEALLDEDDADIWDWLTGKTEADPKYHALLEQLKHYQP